MSKLEIVVKPQPSTTNGNYKVFLMAVDPDTNKKYCQPVLIEIVGGIDRIATGSVLTAEIISVSRLGKVLIKFN